MLSTSEYAIETDELSRRFGSVSAVESMGLTVPNQSVFGFLGPNGAGKTTTIRMLLGLIRPSAGTVKINGHCLHRERSRALAGVGAIVESPALYANLTGLNILNMAAQLGGHAQAEVFERLEQVGLTDAARRKVGDYSLGMRQRLALARAMLGSPKLLILDEPTNGLDPAGIADMRNLIKALPETLGATVFLSSHLLSEIEQTATHCALIDKGRLVHQDSLDALIADAPSRLAIETDKPDALKRRFESAGISTTCDGNVVWSDQDLTESQRADLIATLIGEGFAISGAWVERATLEDLFLTLTGTTRQAET